MSREPRSWQTFATGLPVLGRVVRGVAASRAQVGPFAAAWAENNRGVVPSAGHLWVVLGDSAAQGIGAASHTGGYVGQLRHLLEQRSGHPWQVLNLSRSGARAAHVLRVQLPAMAAVQPAAALVTCAVGGNDLLRTPTPELLNTFRALLASLPAGAVIATMPQGLGERRAQAINAMITAEAPGQGLVVADLYAHTGPPYAGRMAADQFHPNEAGYSRWTRALAEVIRLQGSTATLADPGPD
ncbi:MAG: SGNH/GDSL hydrolase family protein [Candidatus Dormibacteria bacterium]